jgi:hypothetical protein
MGLRYRARVSERWFLNLSGFHGGVYVISYIEDTRERGLEYDCDEEDCRTCPYNFEPRMILEIADCNDRISLEFDVDSEAGPRQLAAQARHPAGGPSRLSRGRARRVRAVRPAGARARRTAGLKSDRTGGGEHSSRRPRSRHTRVWRNRQTHRSQKPDSEGSTPSARTLPP